ncbi:hypothetical protein BsWGS_12772 [Bradybaena similaris]
MPTTLTCPRHRSLVLPLGDVRLCQPPVPGHFPVGVTWGPRPMRNNPCFREGSKACPLDHQGIMLATVALQLSLMFICMALCIYVLGADRADICKSWLCHSCDLDK